MSTSNLSLVLADLKAVTAFKAPVRHMIRRTTILSGLFAVLLGTGLYLEFLAGRNWNSGEAVLLVHLALGIVFTGLFLSWFASHVHQGLAGSQRSLFTWLSWLLLAKYALLIVTGLLLILPAIIYLGGAIWFWRFETTDLLSFLHLWDALAATAGLLVHLALRHWRQPAGGRET